MARNVAAFLSLLLCLGSAAQTAPRTAGGNTTQDLGTVSGHVLCSDTQRPARVAEVRLVPVPASDAAPSSRAKSQPGSERSFSPVLETDMDGRFTATGVKAGRYFVQVTLDGYLTPLLSFSQAELASPTPEVRARLRSEVTEVVVAPNAPAQVEMSLNRGASVQGVVLYDDGTPAIGLRVDLLKRDAKGLFTERVDVGGFLPPTDEHGRFHYRALPAGEYVAEVMLTINEHNESTAPAPDGKGEPLQFHMVRSIFELPVFSGDTLRRRDAVPFKLAAGEARTDLSITIPLSKLHHVSGSLVAKDGHTLNAGKLILRYPDDDTELTSVAVNHLDSTFHFAYVPEGTYNLAVEEARDVSVTEVPNAPGLMPPTRQVEKTLHRYGAATLPLVVESDADGVIATVPDAQGEISAP